MSAVVRKGSKTEARGGAAIIITCETCWWTLHMAPYNSVQWYDAMLIAGWHNKALHDKEAWGQSKADESAQTITGDMIERAALAIAEVDEWPTNEELGGGPTGTRDDEFRDEHIDMARVALEAALGEENK